MSFILDALKKSETERQRADAPALYEMKAAPPRRGVATWLIVLAGLLVINIVVLSVVLLRGTRDAPAPTPPTLPAPAAAGTTVPAPVSPAPMVGVASTAAPPPAAIPPTAPPDTVGSRPSEDDVPAVEPPHMAAGTGDQGGSVRATGGDSGELPSYQQAAAVAGANLPELTLDMHAYAANADDRFIFLNMTKLKEGQTSPQGIRVESITPDGAILSWRGSKFLLQRQ